MKDVPLREQSIVLIGFMGVGKTTIGKAVAKKLYRDFIDIDEEIEKKFNMPPSDIFKEYGESIFRQTEKELIIDSCKQKLKIISVGGGAFYKMKYEKRAYPSVLSFSLIYHGSHGKSA